MVSVTAIDILYIYGYCAFTVLFYKASSKENSSMILGRFYTFLSETEGETRPQATSQFLYYTLKIANILIRLCEY